jgi:hypothetical protein
MLKMLHLIMLMMLMQGKLRRPCSLLINSKLHTPILANAFAEAALQEL